MNNHWIKANLNFNGFWLNFNFPNSIFRKHLKIIDFVQKSREAIVKESQVDIAFVDDKLVYPARNNLDNFIIIPVSLAFVVALIVFNFVCQRKKLVDFI